MWTRGLIDEELDALVSAFEGIARASYQRGMSIISLICNIQRTSQILERVTPGLFHLLVLCPCVLQCSKFALLPTVILDTQKFRVLHD